MKNKFLKGTTLVLSSLMLLGVVSCGGTNNNDSSSQASETSETSKTSSSEGGEVKVVDFVPTEKFDTTKKINLNFYTTMGQALQEVYNEYYKDFKEAYPNINVNLQVIGGYDDVRDQMTTTISAGKNDVNIAYCYPDHVALYNKAKSVISLDGFINSADYGFSRAQKNDFIDAYYEEGKSFGDGKMYTLPFTKSSEVMYYNKDFFDKNNLEVPTHWWSNGDNDTTSMDYVIRKIKEIEPDSIPLGYDSESNLFITMCEQLKADYTSAIGNHYRFNNDKAKEFSKKLNTWYKDGLMTTKQLYGGYTSSLFTTNEKQKCYICIGSSAGASYQTSETLKPGIAPIPQADETNKKVIQQGPNICIFTNDDQQKLIASWLWVKFFTTNAEFQCSFSMESGYTPVLKSCAENEIYANWLKGATAQAASTAVTMAQADNYFTSPAFVGSSKARETVGKLLVNVLKSDGSDASINSNFENAIQELEF